MSGFLQMRLIISFRRAFVIFTPPKVIRFSAFRKAGKRRNHIIGKVLIGLAIAVPFLVLVIYLLASADGVFHYLLSGIPKWLGQLSYNETILRGIWVLSFSFLFFGYLWGFVKRKTYHWEKKASRAEAQAQAAEGGARAKASVQIDPIIIATVLIAFNAVYVLFVVVQFSYLFGAWQGVLPEGSSYAEYARSGFFELIAVSLINFAIMLAALVFGGGHGQKALEES